MKKRVICVHDSFLSYGPLLKKVHFLQFCADLSQKPKSVEAIYMNGSESSYCSLSENDMVYTGLKKERQKHHTHNILILSLLLVIIMV